MTMPKGWSPPGDRKQALTSEKLDDKKWLVSRFEVGLRSLTSETTVAREQFKSRVSRIDMNLKDWRNAILAGVTFAAAITVGIASAFPNDAQTYRQVIIILLIVDILVGVAVYFIIGILRDKAHSLIVLRDGSFLVVLHRMYFLENYFNRYAESLQETSSKRLGFFIKYLYFGLQAAKFEQLEILYRMMTSFAFRSLRTEIQVAIQVELILRDAAYEFYMKYEQEFSSFQQNLNDLKFVHGDFLEYYNYILSIQEENEGT